MSRGSVTGAAARGDPRRGGGALEALSRLAMPVVVISAASADERSCATGTLMYVSFEPTRIAVALHPGSRTTALVRASGQLAVSLLRSGDVETAIAAGRGARTADKLAELGVELMPPPAGFSAPAIADAVAALWARVDDARTVGDHVLVVATVVDQWVRGDDAPADGSGEDGPLLRHRRRYASLGQPVGPSEPDRYPL